MIRSVTYRSVRELLTDRLGVFTTREAAEEFVRDDPFVLNGVVARYHFHEWNEVLA